MNLTPAHSDIARHGNYTYWNGTGKAPNEGALTFTDKAKFVEFLYEDLGWETASTTGEPLGIWVPDIKTGFPVEVGPFTNIGGPGFQWLVVLKGTKRLPTTVRFPHIGGLTFGRHVTLGSNVTIDRGALGATHISDNVHIDSQVHVGHNAYIGRNSIITAGAIIGGSAVLVEQNYVGLGAVIRNQVRVGRHAKIGQGANVVADIPAGDRWWVGNPAREMT
jgi:UDP-3-O-[3-hydroxymyristoyl] glucosamine N-acyltransferase